MCYKILKMIMLFCFILFSCQYPDQILNTTSNKSNNENVDSPIILLDFGLTGDINQPCYLLSGDINEKIEDIQPVFKKTIEVEDAPTSISFNFNISDPNKKYIIKLFSKSGYDYFRKAQNRGNLYINQNKYEYIHSHQNLQHVIFENEHVDNHLDKYSLFKEVSLKATNKIKIDVQEERAYKLTYDFIVYPENTITTYCNGIPSFDTNFEGEIQTLQQPLSKLKADRGKSFYRKISTNGEEFVGFENAIKIKNKVPESFIKKYQALRNLNLIHLTPENNLLKKAPKIISSFLDAKAISFSSLRGYYIFAAITEYQKNYPDNFQPEIRYLPLRKFDKLDEFKSKREIEDEIDEYLEEGKEALLKYYYISSSEALKKATILADNNAYINTLYAAALFYTGKHQEAIMFLKSKEQSPEVIKQIALFYSILSDCDNAGLYYSYIDSTIKNCPLHIDAHLAYERAKIYFIDSQLDEAEKAIKHALELQNDYYDAKFILGSIQGEKGLYKEALEQYLSIPESPKEYKQLNNNIALAYYYLGMLDEAKIYCNKIGLEGVNCPNGAGLIIN